MEQFLVCIPVLNFKWRSAHESIFLGRQLTVNERRDCTEVLESVGICPGRPRHQLTLAAPVKHAVDYDACFSFCLTDGSDAKRVGEMCNAF